MKPHGNINKNTIYVEDNNTNIYVTFQLHPPYDFWEKDFLKFKVSVAMATNQKIWTKFIWFV